MNKYTFYCLDVETTGLNPIDNDIIELSIYRLSDDVQKTWCIKPLNVEKSDPGALRVSGHKLEDLKCETKFGRDTYKDPNSVIIEVENFLSEDCMPAESRVLIAHNASFDKMMLEYLWKKCNAFDSFPFGRRVLDTMVNELYIDFCKNDFAEGYSLKNLSKKYNVHNDKAHSAAADTKCTVEVFKKQTEFVRSLLSKSITTSTRLVACK